LPVSGRLTEPLGVHELGARGWNPAASQELSEILTEGEAGVDLTAGYTSA